MDLTEGKGKYNFDFKGKTVLVVEDNDISFRLIDAMLSRVNVHVLHAFNGQEAIDHCAENQSIGLVLMDIQLPELNGLEATRQILAVRPGLHIIATTANAFEEDKAACMEAGCSAYVTKPIHFQRLFELMQSFFEQQS